MRFLGLTPGDGDCFFHAISLQLEGVGAGLYCVEQERELSHLMTCLQFKDNQKLSSINNMTLNKD